MKHWLKLSAEREKQFVSWGMAMNPSMFGCSTSSWWTMPGGYIELEHRMMAVAPRLMVASHDLPSPRRHRHWPPFIKHHPSSFTHISPRSCHHYKLNRDAPWLLNIIQPNHQLTTLLPTAGRHSTSSLLVIIVSHRNHPHYHWLSIVHSQPARLPILS